MKKYILMSLAAVVMLMSSCSKEYLITTPTGSVGNPVVFENIDNVEKALMGAYYHFAYFYEDNANRAAFHMNIKGELTAGTLVRPNKSNGWFWADYTFTIYDSNTAKSFWYLYRYMYLIIKEVNSIIYYGSELEVSEADIARKDYVIAEAKAIRAYCYDKLAIFFALRSKEGHNNSQLCVPLMLDPTETEGKARNTLAEVVGQIKKDLGEAEAVFSTSNFTPEYQKGPAERFGLAAVELLTARIAMYTHDYATAKTYAKKVADKYDIMGVEAYYEGFNDLTNKEWIFGVMTTAVNPTYYGAFYAYMGSNYSSSFYKVGAMCIDTRYLSQIPDTDLRIKEADGTIGLWMTGTQEEIEANGKQYYYDEDFLPTASSTAIFTGMTRKYKTTAPNSTTGDGDYPYMRGAEAYYLTAEAAALTGDLATAQKYLEGAVQPYDPTFEAASNTEDVLEQIALYKVFDMYGEGQSYEDFKRRGTLVSRSGSNHPTDCLVYEYGPKEDQPRNDVFTYPMPKIVLTNNKQIVATNSYN